MGLRLLLALAGAAATLVADPPQNKTARQLFYDEDAPAPPAAVKPVKKAKKATAEVKKAASTPEAPAPQVISAASGQGSSRSLGLRYSLVQVQEGSPAEVSSDKVFRSGDQVKLRVEGNREGYLYVVTRGSSGLWKPLFPSADIAGGNNRIAARRPLELPSTQHAFTFDEQPGDEQLFVVYSLQPVKDLEELIHSLRQQGERPARPINDSLVSELRAVYSRDLVLQKVDAAEPLADWKPENAVYVVSNSGGRLVADIRLTHR
jgi:hypothetical protein